jgi:hypothetical protein
MAEVDDVYDESLVRARNNGLESREEKLKRAIENGEWSVSKDKSLESYQSDISRLYAAKSNLQNRKHLFSLTEEITLLEKSWADLLTEKHGITHGCAEDFADNLSNQHQIFISIYKDEALKNRMYSNEEFEYLDSDEYLDVLILCRKSMQELSTDTIRKLSSSLFFQEAFSLLTDITDFFQKPVYNLSFYQVKLLKYGSHFKSILTEFGSPPSEYFGDPDKLEEWYYIRKSGLEKEEQETKKNEDSWRSLLQQ